MRFLGVIPNLLLLQMVRACALAAARTSESQLLPPQGMTAGALPELI